MSTQTWPYRVGLALALWEEGGREDWAEVAFELGEGGDAEALEDFLYEKGLHAEMLPQGKSLWGVAVRAERYAGELISGRRVEELVAEVEERAGRLPERLWRAIRGELGFPLSFEPRTKREERALGLSLVLPVKGAWAVYWGLVQPWAGYLARELVQWLRDRGLSAPGEGEAREEVASLWWGLLLRRYGVGDEAAGKAYLEEQGITLAEWLDLVPWLFLEAKGHFLLRAGP